ncbi:hypothetical protein NSPZN2_10227 [Nitrospira defluvii]|uniref:Uncharacterized protein n=1 Tax=Nitrospira defluvii TaxID=330214 RepID=A0ABM8QDK7_9BACT|nr:hypothetical protein NSPZN2_10227 [Nitrospira defluvii]
MKSAGYVVRSSRPARLFSFSLLDVLDVRLRQPHVRKATAGFGLERLASAFPQLRRRSRVAQMCAVLTREYC